MTAADGSGPTGQDGSDETTREGPPPVAYRRGQSPFRAALKEPLLERAVPVSARFADYRAPFTRAGFRVVDEGRNQGGFFDAELEFSNNALDGNIDFDGDRVEIDLERY